MKYLVLLLILIGFVTILSSQYANGILVGDGKEETDVILVGKVKYSTKICFIMSKPADLGSLKIGSYILLPVSDQPDGEACRITEYDTSKPGKHGAAKARIVGVGVFDGKSRPHVGPVSMQVHIPLIDKRTGQIISIIGDTTQVMDSETFETIDVTLVDSEINGVLENGQNVEYWKVMDRTKIMRIKS